MTNKWYAEETDPGLFTVMREQQGTLPETNSDWTNEEAAEIHAAILNGDLVGVQTRLEIHYEAVKQGDPNPAYMSYDVGKEEEAREMRELLLKEPNVKGVVMLARGVTDWFTPGTKI